MGKVIFGRMNYNKEITAFESYKDFYNQQVEIVVEFCKERAIDYHIKQGTIS